MTDSMRLYDVTPVISPKLGVWPKDTAPSRQVLMDLKDGNNITLSTLHTTVHLGAHADAPSHYKPDGPTIEARSLEYYLGPCQVIHVEIDRKERIKPDSVTAAIETQRILFATGTFPDPNQFNEDFAALSPELIDWLYSKGVKTIGIDTPSIDLFDSKDLPAHQAAAQHDMAILEGLVLTGVPDDKYELIALPLRLAEFDASPVRAILRTVR